MLENIGGNRGRMMVVVERGVGVACLCLKVFLLWSASSNSEEFNMLAKINMYPNIAGQATLLGKLS